MTGDLRVQRDRGGPRLSFRPNRPARRPAPVQAPVQAHLPAPVDRPALDLALASLSAGLALGGIPILLGVLPDGAPGAWTALGLLAFGACLPAALAR